VRENTLALPHRYKDAAKSRCFGQSNVYRDLYRGVKEHPKSKMHVAALKMLHPEEQPDIEAIDSDHEEWSANTYLAVRHLVRLQPYVDFKEAVADACELGGSTTGQQFKSQLFYDECLKYADQVEQRLLCSEIARSPFKILVVGNDCKENISATSAYFVVKGANGWMHVEQRCLGVERLHQESHQTLADHVTNLLMEAY
jgi:hypothetical protein